jgi:hypothetical protein
MEMRRDHGAIELNVCSVGSGCRVITGLRSLISMKWPWALVSVEGEGKERGARGYALHDLEKKTEVPVRVADRLIPVFVTESEKHTPIIMTYGTEAVHSLTVQTVTGERLWAVDLPLQKAFHGYPFPKGASAPNQVLIANPYARAENEFLRINLSEQSIAQVLAFPKATIERHADGTVGVWGDAASLQDVLWCRKSPADTMLVPFENCRAELESESL